MILDLTESEASVVQACLYGTELAGPAAAITAAVLGVAGKLQRAREAASHESRDPSPEPSP